MFDVDVTTIDSQMEAIIDELLTGAGAVVIRNAYDEGTVREARELIMEFSKEQDKETHFQGAVCCLGALGKSRTSTTRTGICTTERVSRRG